MPRILLVDDSEPNRDMLARRLQRRGYEVLQAMDGQEAIDMARREAPDLILMDLNLPTVDGWTATRQIKADPGTRAVPVIALTAHAMSGDRQRATEAGCDDYDTKPVELPRLLGKIEALLRRSSQPIPGAPLPVGAKTEAASAVSAGAPVDVTAETAGRVLVVDDTEANRDVAARYLRRKGFVVDLAADGHQALELAGKVEYDAVLLDVMMPGINGIEVLRRLRESHAPTILPVIMATANDASEDVVQALTLGANDYVTKPLDFPVLLARVGTQVSLKRSVEQIHQLERGLEQRNRELQAANTQMRTDLQAAARIQAALLPTTGPEVDGYRFAWRFEPSVWLAGDILNVFRLDAHRVGAYVLDVSGHGVASALLSVTISRFLSPAADPSSMLWYRKEETLASADGPGVSARLEIEPPERVAERLSHRFPFDEVTFQYFTMVYGLLDTARHEFRYISAGHPAILRVRANGEADELAGTGFPIGVGPDGHPYDAFSVLLEPGDRLYIHSDGLTEAMDPGGELFGTRRLLDAIRAFKDATLDASLHELSKVIRTWTGTDERKDDQTVLAIERLPTPTAS